MTRRSRAKKTSLGTSLTFEVVRPDDYPRGFRAYVYREVGFYGYRWAIRPEPREPGTYRIDRLWLFAEAETGLGGTFDSPEQAAWALEQWFRRGRRPPTKDEGLELLVDALADAARASGMRTLYLGGSPTILRATI